MKKIIQYYSILILTVSCAYGQKENKDLVAVTDYFEFHSNYWMNLHHFLYQKASGEQLRNLQQDGNQFLEIGEEEIYDTLNSEQVQALDDAIAYYKENIASKSLLFELNNERIWLQNQYENISIIDTTFTKKYTQILNQVSPIYKQSFWPIHKAHNRYIVEHHLSIIKTLENSVIPKMEQLSLKKWPSRTKVRVDITTYSNYAGAYTVKRPKFNIFISSIDPNSKKLAFIETVFHEGSHLLFNLDGTFRSRISELFNKKKLNIKYPRSLWHVSLFYLCGRTLQDEFKKMNYPVYEMILDDRNIFSKYNTKSLRNTLEAYYQNEVDYNTTINRLLDNLK